MIPAAVRASIAEHARTELPNEACGLLLLEGDEAVEYVPAENASPSPYYFELRLDPVVWADLGDRTVEDVFGLDRLVTSVMLYAMTGTFTSSTWLYTGGANDKHMPEGRRVTVPTGYVSLNAPRHPRTPRSFIERGFDVVHWSEQPRGGHFASMEIPDELAADIRTWASKL